MTKNLLGLLSQTEAVNLKGDFSAYGLNVVTTLSSQTTLNF
jgi:hypothetical protein